MEVAVYTGLPAKWDMQVDACRFLTCFLNGEIRLLHCHKLTKIAAEAYLNFIYHMLILSSIVIYLSKNYYFYNLAIFFITK